MKKTNLLLTFFVIIAIASCDNSKTENQFTLLSSNETGVDFINKLYEDNQINYFTYPYIYMGGGVSVGDINNDNLDDLQSPWKQTAVFTLDVDTKEITKISILLLFTIPE